VKKALIVSPYLDHLGGGERYMLSAAQVLETLGYQIYFGWDNLGEINQLSTMLGISLKNPQLDITIKDLYTSHNPLSMYLATRDYDVVFYLSDGSLPLLGGKRNIVHMQVPFHHIGGSSLKNKLKKLFIHHVVVNSRFTKAVIDREYSIDSLVLYPPVTSIGERSSKENLILSVGRFDPSLNAKHQDVLIEAFKELSPSLPGWKLVLAGGSSSEEWIAQLQQKATGFPIEIRTNVAHTDLANLYQSARIYWHAAGYQVDEQKNPELTEHFGISTVEAISAGCLPLVVPYGGQREIVTDTNLHWTSIEQLVEKTKTVVTALPTVDFRIEQYGVKNFTKKLSSLL
jgi:glycosyltransferase involved in cell wall biosynthesis